jgi:hypothetical protein
VASPGLSSPPEVAQITWEVADKALSTQTEEWKDLRGRVATLATLGPAAAAVIVTATSGKFDLVAVVALVALLLGVGQSIVALLLAGTPSTFLEPRLPDPLPQGTEPETLWLALARTSEQIRKANFRQFSRIEGLFFGAAGCFLVAVLLWSIHAAANTDAVFTLS